MEKLGKTIGNSYHPFTGWKDEGHGYHHYYVYDSHFGTVAPSMLSGLSTGYREGVIHPNPKDFKTIDAAMKHVEQMAVLEVGR